MSRKAKVETKVEQAHHYFAVNVIGWSMADTRAAAIAKVLKQSKGMLTPDDNGGTYVWSARVDLPSSASYAIENYMPKDVPMSDSKQGSFKLHAGNVVSLSRVED